MVKTNVMRVLDKEKIAYEPFSYSPELTEGVKIAEVLGEDPACVFKTLVTESGDKEHFVFVIPVAETLDLKAAARAVGAKSVSMLKQKELLPLTGYVHGGCSPIGMKKRFPTYIDESCNNFDSIVFSAGRIGRQVELSIADLTRLTGAQIAPLTKEEEC